ncbi:MAG TPA: hypothetical protein VLE43_21390, partial [Candidatus Saccharimonadia bacterium]|nr:hypothetical protein [Candidatus Saccharimonadia bacterium]
MHTTFQVVGSARKPWCLPLPVDALLHYSMLGSCYACFLGCFAIFWIAATDFPPEERLFPLQRASLVEAEAANSAESDSVIALNADGSLFLDGRSMGERADRRLQSLTAALLLRKERNGTAPP